MNEYLFALERVFDFLRILNKEDKVFKRSRFKNGTIHILGRYTSGQIEDIKEYWLWCLKDHDLTHVKIKTLQKQGKYVYPTEFTLYNPSYNTPHAVSLTAGDALLMEGSQRF